MEEVLSFHNIIITLDGGARGILDRGAIEAAVARPQATFGGVEFFASPFSKAAALMESLVQRHPFVEGNKRTGLMAGVFLLDLAGYELTASPRAPVDITLEVVDHRLDTESLARWLEQHSQPKT